MLGLYMYIKKRENICPVCSGVLKNLMQLALRLIFSQHQQEPGYSRIARVRVIANPNCDSLKFCSGALDNIDLKIMNFLTSLCCHRELNINLKCFATMIIL